MSEERNITARFTADTSGFSPAVNELVQKLKSLNGEYEQNQQKIKQLNTEMKGYQSRLKELENMTGPPSRQQMREMDDLRGSIARCVTELGTYRAAQSTLRSDITQTTRELGEQRDAVNNVSNAAATFGDVLKANIISDVVHMGLQKTLELLRSAAAYCYQVGTSFEAAMSQVEAISGANASQLEALTAKAKELGSTTKFTATEAAGAMNYMAMAGWDAEQMLSGIDGVLSLAAASGEDLGTTADIVSDALTAFKMKAEDVGHFSDVLAAASANANTNVSMLGESFKYVAPLAGTMGYSIEETAEALGIMANSGIKASTAGTSMRTMLTNLTSGVTITSTAFGEMKVSAANADGTMKSLNTVLGELRAAFAQMSKAEQSMNAKTIAGDKALSGFLALMNAGEADINKLRNAIENCDGAAASMAETMQNNLAGQVTIFQSALEGLGISVYDKFGGALLETVGIFTDCISDMTDSVENGELDQSISRLADSFKSAATEFAGFASDNLPGFVDGIADALNFVITFRNEIGSLIKGVIAFKGAMAIGDIIRAAVRSFTSLKTAISGASGAQEVLNNTMAANPFGLVAVAIGMVITAASELEAHLDDCNQKASDTMETVGELIDTSQRYRDTAKDLGDVITRFEEITESEDNAAKKNNELTQLQETLISLCGSEADGIDLVTGAFANQAEVLGELNRLKNDYNQKSLEEAEDALKRLNEAEQYKTAVSINSTVSGGYNTVLWAAQNLKTFDTSGTVGGQAATKWNTYGALFKDNMLYLSGSYEERLSDLMSLKDYLLHEGGLNTNDEAVRNVTALIEQLQADSDSKELYTQMISNLQSGNDADYTETPFVTATATEEERKAREAAARYQKWKAEQEAKAEKAKKSAEELAEEYKAQKQLADDMYGVGEISAQEYYNRLTVLRDSYLEQGSHEWYVATKEIKSLAEKLGDDLGKTAKTTAEKIKDALSDVKSEYQKTLDAIDAELERHNREKQDKEYQGKVDALNARLKYEQLDIFSRRELEQELADIYEEWDETKYQRDTVDAKSLLETVYTQTQDMINMAPDGNIADLLNTTFSTAFEGISKDFANSIEQGTATTQAIYNITINGMDKTPEQIRRETIRAISSSVI